MKCSFKNIRINILLFTAIMTLSGRGNPVKKNEVFVNDNGQMKYELAKEREYIDGSADFQEIGPNQLLNNRLMLSQSAFEKPLKFKAKLEPQIILQRKRVSLNHFPREMSRRKEEGSIIRQRNFRDDNTHRWVDIPYVINDGNGKRKNVDCRNNGYFPIQFQDKLENRRKRPISKKFLTISEPFENGAFGGSGGTSSFGLYEPCCARAPTTYVVDVESGEDEDELGPTCKTQQQFPLYNKYYYVFEKNPFKVKFLNLFPSSNDECVSPVMKPTCESDRQNCKMKISLPAFQCSPPECREVLYCRYFQCTSLGFFPDSRNCSKYFFCDLNSNGFVLYHMLCPKGRIFDPVLRECRLNEVPQARSVRRSWIGDTELKRDERLRIKKNLQEMEEFIKYKELSNVNEFGYRRLEENPKKVRRKSNDSFDFERIKRRRDPSFNSEVLFEEKDTTLPPAIGYPCTNISTQLIPIPVFTTLPKACEQPVPALTSPMPIFTFSPAQTTTMATPTPQTRPKTVDLTKPSPAPTKAPLTVKTTVATATTKTCTTTTYTTTTTIPPPPMTTVKTTTMATTRITNPVTKSTSPTCPPPPPKNQTCFSSINLGQCPAESAVNYQYEMQDDYGDDYYDAPDKKEIQKSTYDWLKQSLSEYLDLLDKQKEKLETENVKTESISEQSILPALNGIQFDKDSTGKNKKYKFLIFDSDRGKRSENATAPEVSRASPELPDFEKCYNDQKPLNLDGYPCKQYKRYPDKFDSTQYYECGAQPDGNMKIEHKRCPKGEVFSSEYLECIAPEFIKLTHRKKRYPVFRKNGLTTTTLASEYNEENDKDIPQNEWIDVNHPVKIPNEFKSKSKHNLRIFHLKCKRNSTESPVIKLNGPGEWGRHHHVRSFEIRPNKKDASEQVEDEDDEEYEDEEEYYDREDENLTEKSTTRSDSSSSSYSMKSQTYSTTSDKILLDANIHVDREFEIALKNILGKTEESRPNKDSILIRLSGERSKRNFIKDLFSKKSKDPVDDPEKEGIVSILTLINGLPSQYERDVLMEKLEKRKMMDSHNFQNRQKIIKKKRRKRINEKNPLEYQLGIN